MASCPTVVTFKIVPHELGYPCIKVTGELTPRLNRTITTLDRTLHELFLAIKRSQNYIDSLTDWHEKLANVDYQYEITTNSPNKLIDVLKIVDTSSKDICTGSGNIEEKSSIQSIKKKSFSTNSEFCDNIPGLNISNSNVRSMKSQKKNEKILENLCWNVSIIKTELDSLNHIKNECISAFSQIKRIAESLERIFEKEHKIILRSNSYVVRELTNVNNYILQNQGFTNEGTSDSRQQLSASGSDGQLRSILKKPTSPTPSMKFLNNMAS